MLSVRHAVTSDVPRFAEILTGLPEYFTEDVTGAMRDGWDRRRGWVVCRDERFVLGFAVVEQRSHETAEILWMAVDAAERNRGVGRVLLDEVLTELASSGVRLVEAKTLDHMADYAPYEATRAFWEHRGFVKIDSIDPLPGWEPGNPSAIYVAALAPTRPSPQTDRPVLGVDL